MLLKTNSTGSPILTWNGRLKLQKWTYDTFYGVWNIILKTLNVFCCFVSHCIAFPTREFQYLSWIMHPLEIWASIPGHFCMKSLSEILLQFTLEWRNHSSRELQSLSSFVMGCSEIFLLLIKLARSLKKYFSMLSYIRLNIGISPVPYHSLNLYSICEWM